MIYVLIGLHMFNSLWLTDYPSRPEVSVQETPGKNNISVTMGWMQETDVSYNISIVPEVAIQFVERTNVRLNLFYNTEYSVRITATMCGRNNEATDSYYVPLW